MMIIIGNIYFRLALFKKLERPLLYPDYMVTHVHY